MENRELHFLAKISEILSGEVDTSGLISGISSVLGGYIGFEKFSVYIYFCVCRIMFRRT